MDVYSENSYGVCVPTNSSANEVIVGMARAAALSSSGKGGAEGHLHSTSASKKVNASYGGSHFGWSGRSLPIPTHLACDQGSA